MIKIMTLLTVLFVILLLSIIDNHNIAVGHVKAELLSIHQLDCSLEYKVKLSERAMPHLV